MTIKKFIELGWHTIPLQGEIKRLENGKKTLPEFPYKWKEKYTAEFNTKDSKLGGAITGKCSGIIAVDCDNSLTLEMFKALDPNYKVHFTSIGKKDGLNNPQKAATIIYKYVEELEESYVVHNDTLSLDFLSSDRMTFLPTEANTTKEEFDPSLLNEIKEPPPAVIALIKALKPVKITREESIFSDKTWRNHLAPQVDRFVKAKKLIPELFRVITPKDFRDLDEYVQKGFLAPSEIPDGRGSEYLSKISAILGADESISVELYIDAMTLINDLFSEPMPKVRLSSTIIEPMVEERASVNGNPIWQYNEAWQEDKVTIVTKRNNMLEAFYDSDRMRYYVADVVVEGVKSFSSDKDFVSYIEAIAVEAPSKKELKTRLPLVNVFSTPKYQFGFFNDDLGRQAFNTFSPSIALSIFREPERYAKNYSRPTTILSYLETLVPDHYMRNYLLRFLKRKLTHFEYSPVILYLLGVAGAGKDTLVNIIANIIGPSSMARPTTREFLEMYNGWMLDKYFVQLDEYGNQLVKFDDKEQALGKIKAYTGKAEVQIRQMRSDGFNYIHNITFIMTANKNPLFLDHDDRRIALFNCPNKLENAEWVINNGGISEVIERIEKEIPHFAYYLATEVDILSKDDYMSPPETEDKKILIASKFSAGQKIAFLLSAKMYKELEELSRDFGIETLFDGAQEGRIYEEDLFDLYYEMTDSKGTKRGLTAAMKEFDKIPTTRNGIKSYYYNVPQLRGFRQAVFDPIEAEISL